MKFFFLLFLLLIVCTIMLPNYYEGKIVDLYIRERLFVEKMHQKKANAETFCKIWFVPFVVWATMMGNECFMITIYIWFLFFYMSFFSFTRNWPEISIYLLSLNFMQLGMHLCACEKWLCLDQAVGWRTFILDMVKDIIQCPFQIYLNWVARLSLAS